MFLVTPKRDRKSLLIPYAFLLFWGTSKSAHSDTHTHTHSSNDANRVICLGWPEWQANDPFGCAPPSLTLVCVCVCVCFIRWEEPKTYRSVSSKHQIVRNHPPFPGSTPSILSVYLSLSFTPFFKNKIKTTSHTYKLVRIPIPMAAGTDKKTSTTFRNIVNKQPRADGWLAPSEGLAVPESSRVFCFVFVWNVRT